MRFDTTAEKLENIRVRYKNTESVPRRLPTASRGRCRRPEIFAHRRPFKLSPKVFLPFQSSAQDSFPERKNVHRSHLAVSRLVRVFSRILAV